MMRKVIKTISYLAIIALILTVVPSAWAGASSSSESRDTRVIVIDAGHGGRDSGAIGPKGSKEKEVVLAISTRLGALIEKTMDVKVLYTRADDTFLTLKERTAFANRHKADMFISIHANASRRRSASGVETYFLNFEASDDEARKTAALENKVLELDDVGDGPTGELEHILWDLAQTESHHESSRLAENIYSRLFAARGGEVRGVKQAPFHVLVGATMPAVLVEVGFISNPREEAVLTSNRGQAKLARAILGGVEDFERASLNNIGSAESRREEIYEARRKID